jgi:hypothetical protein
MRRGILLSILFLLCLLSLEAATCHVIIAGDVDDERIGFSVEKDMSAFHDFVQDVAIYGDFELSETILTGNDFTIPKVTAAVKNLRISPEDIVIFYQSSHGYRTIDMREPWPKLGYGARGLKLQTVIDEIDVKRPAFSLILADTCNTFAYFAKYIRIYQEPMNLSSESLRWCYRQLFCHSRGQVIACASQPGQAALALSNGGLFTNSFMTALKWAAKNQVWTWEEVLKRCTFYSEFSSSSIDSKQTPQIKTDIRTF